MCLCLLDQILDVKACYIICSSIYLPLASLALLAELSLVGILLFLFLGLGIVSWLHVCLLFLLNDVGLLLRYRIELGLDYFQVCSQYV